MEILKIVSIFAPLLISVIALVFTIKQYSLDKKLKSGSLGSSEREEYEKKYKSGKTAVILLSIILFWVLIFTGIFINTLSTKVDGLKTNITELSNRNDSLQSKIIELNRTKKERIVLLLPIDSDKESDAYDDGERQALGFIDFLKKHNDKASNYNFVIRNHKMSYDDDDAAEDIVIEELKKGTKYFICTMSKVALPLSANFDTLVENHYNGSGKPLLISTVSSAPSITDNLRENSIYRFYIRSNEEGAELAKAVNSLNSYNTATSIYVKDNYGEGAVEKFKEEWEKLGHIYNNGIYVGAQWDEKSIYNKIEQQIKNRYKPENREVIFIAHYGGGLDKIINSIYKLNMKPLIVATSTLSIKSWQRPIKEPLDSLDWITCVPLLKDEENKLFDGDVVKDFVYFTLDRLISILEKCEKTNKDFNTVWFELREPKKIDYEILTNGDSKIKLKIDYNNIKK